MVDFDTPVLWDVRDILAHFGWRSRTTIWRHTRRAVHPFPKPLKSTPAKQASARWRRDAVLAWEAAL